MTAQQPQQPVYGLPPRIHQPAARAAAADRLRRHAHDQSADLPAAQVDDLWRHLDGWQLLAVGVELLLGGLVLWLTPSPTARQTRRELREERQQLRHARGEPEVRAWSD
jgi:hypothetical protein